MAKIDDVLENLVAVWDETSPTLPGSNSDKTVGVGFTIVGKDTAKQALYTDMLELINDCYDKDYGIDSQELNRKLKEYFGEK